jgi:uncharacterized protein (DUF433 family)
MQRGRANFGEFAILASDQQVMNRYAVRRLRSELCLSEFTSTVLFGGKMGPIIIRNPSIMHGEPCFANTRVCIQTFFDHLEAGYTIAGFLEQFPTVQREQVVELLAELRKASAQAAMTT